ncbi:vomeronasal type-2 receptor 26-like [Hyla sarda]|uniref:vomeronasal type-2 receptor 26-like n=1 Tax=Hyla sarda TaxID=327740 RepID=UPI0024C26CE9|nr:vomeronasal type-2 receptor 26-like [Hyla sarda]
MLNVMEPFLSRKILFLVLLCATPCGCTTERPSSSCNLRIVPAYEDYEYVQDGDIILGGLFSVHCLFGQKSIPENPYVKSMICFRPLHQFYRNLQIFLFAIDQLNKDPTLLPNMTLGYHIYDSCFNPQKAIKNVLQMLSGPGETAPNYSCRKNWRLAGFIGDQSSTTTLPISQLLSVYRYPVISYGATDFFLGDRHLYPHFFRTIQKDFEIYHNLCKLLRHFGWNWIGIITSYDESGEKESSLLTRFLTYYQICIAFVVQNVVKNVYATSALYQFIKTIPVQVIILCGTYHDLIFEPPIGKWLRNVTMILTPSWGPNIVLIEKYPEIFHGSLSLNPFSRYDTKLKHFIDGFHPLNYPDDLLLENLWMTIHHCASGKEEKDKLCEMFYGISLHNCTGRERIRDAWNYLDEEVSDPVYNAVYIMVIALHKIHFLQRNRSSTDSSYQFQIWYALRYLENFGKRIFSGYGEILQSYQIQNHILVNKTLLSSRVGFISSDMSDTSTSPAFSINESLIRWKTVNNEIPKAQCTESCLPGNRKVPGKSKYFCCYGCVACSEGEISNKTDSKYCKRCPDHEWPNENQTQCVSKPVEFLSLSGDVISVIVLAASMLLLTLTAVILGIFIRYRETPIVKANNKNLSFVLLVSIMLSFLCVFLFLGRPVDRTCMIRQIFTGILLSISISSLLAKTITVYIAFKATKPGSVWRTWTGVKLPNCVLLICSSVQGVICMSWVTLSPPFQELDTHSYKEKMVVQCNEGSDLWFYSVLGYLGILAAVSFITAFLARTLPDSFNEAKYITFSMLVFCSVWIAMIPAYLSTKGKYMVAVEIFAILASNTGLLGCIFLPKCFIILYRPEMNTKSSILKS